MMLLLWVFGMLVLVVGHEDLQVTLPLVLVFLGDVPVCVLEEVVLQCQVGVSPPFLYS